VGEVVLSHKGIQRLNRDPITQVMESRSAVSERHWKYGIVIWAVMLLRKVDPERFLIHRDIRIRNFLQLLKNVPKIGGDS